MTNVIPALAQKAARPAVRRWASPDRDTKPDITPA